MADGAGGVGCVLFCGHGIALCVACKRAARMRTPGKRTGPDPCRHLAYDESAGCGVESSASRRFGTNRRRGHVEGHCAHGYPDIRQAVEAVKDGVLDYLTKPIDLDELHDLVAATLGVHSDADEDLPSLPNGLIVQSPSMKHTLQHAQRVAEADVAVLITGESGTGKEVVADLIHSWSARAQNVFVKLNCAAIPENMVESELFGHTKGAFTGAVSARNGRWPTADGGTLLLDEVGELPFPLQAKLLRALQDGSYSPLGSDKTERADVRVIAATNRDLEQDVADGRFREDLYYRLNVIEISLPALRDRSEDILPLARQFAAAFEPSCTRISRAVEQILRTYPWPGNVRELRNVVQGAVLMARGGVMLPEHLSARVLRSVTDSVERGARDSTLADAEKRNILSTLADCKGNRTRAAERLGISRRTLLYRLKAYAQDDVQVLHTTG
jgi:DNA-binding NtrC family response regulator